MITRMKLRAISSPLVAVALAASLAACDAEAAPAGPPVAGDAVAVRDNAFDPAALLVEPGTTVTWAWEGSSRHNVVFDDASSDIQESGAWTHTLTEPGTYDYACTLHRAMTGSVTVG